MLLRWPRGLTLATVLLAAVSTAHGQATQGVTEPDALKAINLLRAELVDSFNKGDINRLLSHLDPDVVVTWQNAEVCRGPQAVKAYHDRMMASPNHIVAKLSANPVVDDRQFPIRPRGVIQHGYPAIAPLVWECMFQSIHHEFGDDQAQAFGLAGCRTSSFAADLERDRSNVANHGGCKGLTQL